MPGVTIRKAREKSFGVLPRGVDRLPGDQHGHDGRLAAARRHLHGQAEQFGIGLLVGLGDLIQKSLRRRTPGRDLSQPDDRLDGFDLAEEGTRTGRIRESAPMLQEPLGDGGHAPVSLAILIISGAMSYTDIGVNNHCNI